MLCLIKSNQIKQVGNIMSPLIGLHSLLSGGNNIGRLLQATTGKGMDLNGLKKLGQLQETLAKQSNAEAMVRAREAKEMAKIGEEIDLDRKTMEIGAKAGKALQF